MDTALLRIVQESLTNIHRHSQRSAAKITFSLSATNVGLHIEDAGVGIPAHKLWAVQYGRLNGVGLPRMRERVRQLGGDFQLTSDSNGTKLFAKFPLPG